MKNSFSVSALFGKICVAHAAAVACLAAYMACASAAPVGGQSAVEIICPFAAPSAKVAKKKDANFSLCKKLMAIEKGGDVNATDKYGQTALMYAAKMNPLAVYWLIAKGADATIKNAKGKTAFDYLPSYSPCLLPLIFCANVADPGNSEKWWGYDPILRETPSEYREWEGMAERIDAGGNSSFSSIDNVAIMARLGYDVKKMVLKADAKTLSSLDADTVRLLLALGVKPAASNTAARFWFAMRMNDAQTVRAALAEHPELAKEGSPLRTASSEEVAKLLLAAGADVKDKDLLACLEHRDAALLKTLLDAGVYTGLDGMGANALHCGRWDAKCVDLLVKAGMDVNAKMRNGATPLHYAARSGTLDMVKALLAHGANPNVVYSEDKRITPLDNALAGFSAGDGRVSSEAADIIFALQKANDNYQGSPLRAMIHARNVSAMHRRFPQNNDVGDAISEQIMRFIELSDTVEPDILLSLDSNTLSPEQWGKIGHALLDKGANPLAVNKRGRTTLATAGFWDKSLAERLVAAGVDVNAGNKAALLDNAVCYRRVEVLEFLFQKGLTVNDKEMESALIALVAYLDADDDGELYDATCLKIAQLLKSHGADLSKALVMHVNVCRSALRAIMSLGYDPHTRSEDGETLLMQRWALEEDFAEQLIKQGVDVNAKDKWGNTTLVHVARKANRLSKEEIMKILKAMLAAGLDAKERTKDNRTIFDEARRVGNETFIECLEECGVSE